VLVVRGVLVLLVVVRTACFEVIVGLENACETLMMLQRIMSASDARLCFLWAQLAPDELHAGAVLVVIVLLR
jgi:hypothetical protein